MAEDPDLVRDGGQIGGRLAVASVLEGLHRDGGAMQPAAQHAPEGALTEHAGIVEVQVPRTQEPMLLLAEHLDFFEGIARGHALLLLLRDVGELPPPHVHLLEHPTGAGGFRDGLRDGLHWRHRGPHVVDQDGQGRPRFQSRLALLQQRSVLPPDADLLESLHALLLARHPQADEEGWHRACLACRLDVAVGDDEELHRDLLALRGQESRRQLGWLHFGPREAVLQSLLLFLWKRCAQVLAHQAAAQHLVQAQVGMEHQGAVLGEPDDGIAEHVDDGLHELLLGGQGALRIEDQVHAAGGEPRDAEPHESDAGVREVHPQVARVSVESPGNLHDRGIQQQGPKNEPT
mmetsp:Transcript_36845/g.83722  ORF Transcript_36845/g.83722 Transcript_36845/m.83722 type:complete len:347 (+) Transcript_36845:728-1768(+)